MKKELVLVKLGGSLITDKSKAETPRDGEIMRLAKEIREARAEGNLDAIVGHGGGSFPHRPASQYKTAQGYFGQKSATGIAVVQDAAARLNRIVVKALIDAGEDAMSFQPSACMISKDGQVAEGFLRPMQIALGYGILPVPYGDVAFDLGQGCRILSTEMILEYAASKMPASRIVIAANEDGVWKDFPARKEIIGEITPKNFSQVRKHLGGSADIDVTGGMLHKVERMLALAKKTKVPVIIVNGSVPGRVRDAMLGKKVVGTRIVA